MHKKAAAGQGHIWNRDGASLFSVAKCLIDPNVIIAASYDIDVQHIHAQMGQFKCRLI